MIDKVTVATPDFDGKQSKRIQIQSRKTVNDFEDISKIRNREDKKITFYTDKDTSTQDFYWRYDRGLENVDTTKEYTIKGEAEKEKKKKKEKNSKI